MKLEYGILAMQIIIIGIVSANAFYAFRTKRNIGKTLEAIYQYRREIAWLTSRIEDLEKGKSNGRRDS